MEDIESYLLMFVFIIVIFLFGFVLPILSKKILDREEYSEWNDEIKQWKKAHPLLWKLQILPFPLSIILYFFPRPPPIYKNKIETPEMDSELDIATSLIQTNEENNEDLISEFNKSIELAE